MQVTPEMIEQLLGGAAAGMTMLWVVLAVLGLCVGFPVALLTIVSAWKVHVKAGQPGWTAVIPFYNFYVLLQIVGKPAWWFLLLFVPIVQFIVPIIVSLGLAERFGRSTLFGILLVVFPTIGLAILAFGSSVYTPAAGAGGGLVHGGG
jgi:hypothetical protein